MDRGGRSDGEEEEMNHVSILQLLCSCDFVNVLSSIYIMWNEGQVDMKKKSMQERSSFIHVSIEAPFFPTSSRTNAFLRSGDKAIMAAPTSTPSIPPEARQC